LKYIKTKVRERWWVRVEIYTVPRSVRKQGLYAMNRGCGRSNKSLRGYEGSLGTGGKMRHDENFETGWAEDAGVRIRWGGTIEVKGCVGQWRANKRG